MSDTLNPIKPTILVFCDFYLPGYKSGGGMRTLVNMVERFGSEYRFLIVTRDHDGWLDRNQYTTVKINGWNQVGAAEVFYLSRSNLRPSIVRDIVLETRPDVIYSNTFFGTLTILVLILRRFRRIPRIPIILAPEGELSEAALGIRGSKKTIFSGMSRKIRLYDDIVWKTNSPEETRQVERFSGSQGKVFLAPNMQPNEIFAEFDGSLKLRKTAGKARMVFLSRFVRIKNFKWLLENIRELAGELRIDVYGPIQDREYWAECENVIASLSKNITVTLKGPIPHAEVPRTLFDHHFFLLPSLSESFGHIILEALSAGCPVITSDRTPWLGLENKGIGWDLPLEEPNRWIQTLQFCIDMDDEEFARRSSRAREFSISFLANPALEQQTRQVLEYGVSKSGSWN